jgi:predicted Zn-dependent protease
LTDSELRVANPFATPWLLDRRIADPMSTDPSAQNPAEKLPAKTTYKLEPDPFDLDLSQSPSKDDARAALRSRTPEPDTAQRLAAMPPIKFQSLQSQWKNSRYDVTRIGDRGVGTNLNFYSLEKEEALGREISQQMEQQAKLVNDPVITEYVNRIGQNLVRHSDARVPFTIKVVDDEQVNAFALPGGFFYVNSGVLLAADNEAELAGVMAHEIAHVAARHATRNATKQDIWNLASLPLIFVGGPVGAAIRELSGIAVPMSFLKFSRDAEREADFLGLEYQYAAGYDPTAFVDFFEKLEAREKQHSGFMARAFSTHPMNDDRIRRAEAELEMLPARDDYVLTTSDFEQVKSRLIRLTRGRTVDDGKAMPTLRKHTAEDDRPPVLKKSPGALQ